MQLALHAERAAIVRPVVARAVRLRFDLRSIGHKTHFRAIEENANFEAPLGLETSDEEAVSETTPPDPENAQRLTIKDIPPVAS